MSTDKIILDQGSGGRATHDLINNLIYPYFENAILNRADDSAVVNIGKHKLAFSTDSFTVDPIFFPGGNIGDLAVNGTVNDLAMSGAVPLYLSVSFIMEEGFPLDDLKVILQSMQDSAKQAGVAIVTGDTKVVHRGAADKIFINTSGIGIIDSDTDVSGHNARPGDKIILTGPIADHGMTVLTQREGLSFDSPLKSDTAPLNHMVKKILARGTVHSLRDPTRGGIGTSLNEIAAQSGVGIVIYEAQIPIRDDTRSVCELLGLDPLYIANEGCLLACVDPKDAESIVQVVQAEENGQHGTIIGEITSDNAGTVLMETDIGGARIINMLSGEELPRIC